MDISIPIIGIITMNNNVLSNINTTTSISYILNMNCSRNDLDPVWMGCWIVRIKEIIKSLVMLKKEKD